MRYIVTSEFTVTRGSKSVTPYEQQGGRIEGFPRGAVVQVYHILRLADNTVEYQFVTNTGESIVKVFPSVQLADMFIAALCGEETQLREQKSLAEF